jgi:hypothetical protein
VLAVNRVEARLARVRQRAEVEQRIGEGAAAFGLDRLDLAAAEYDVAARLAAADPGLKELHDRSAAEADRARRAAEVRRRARFVRGARRGDPIRPARLRQRRGDRRHDGR